MNENRGKIVESFGFQRWKRSSRLTGIAVSVPGNVTGRRMDRIRSGVRDLLQRADHQHSFPSINPIAISIWRARDTRLSRTLDARL